MIFVDSNVPMYLVGAPHPNRNRAVDFLARSTAERLVTSAEVYQEPSAGEAPSAADA